MSNPDEPGAGPPMTNSTASALKYLAEFIEYQPGTTMAPQREKAESCLGVLRAALGARPAQPPEPSEEVLTAAHLRDAAEIVEWYAEATDDNIQSVGATLLADRLRRAVLRAGVPAHPEQDEKLVMTEFGLMPDAVAARPGQPPDDVRKRVAEIGLAWERWATQGEMPDDPDSDIMWLCEQALRAGVPAPPEAPEYEALTAEELRSAADELDWDAETTVDGPRSVRVSVLADRLREAALLVGVEVRASAPSPHPEEIPQNET